MWAGATGVLRVEHARVNFLGGRGKHVAGRRGRLAFGSGLREVMFAGRVAGCLGTLIAPTGKSLVVVGNTSAQTGFGYCFGLRLSGCLDSRTAAFPVSSAAGFCCVQFPHQFTDADAGPGMYPLSGLGPLAFLGRNAGFNPFNSLTRNDYCFGDTLCYIGHAPRLNGSGIK